MKPDHAHFMQRILDVLAKHPKGITRSNLRKEAFNRIPIEVSGKWLNKLVKDKKIVRDTVLDGSRGRPAMVYKLRVK